jgi:hypothetical protein
MPQVVIVEYVLFKVVSLSLKHIALNAANEATVLVIFVEHLILGS